MALTLSLTMPATTALKDGEVVDVPEITYPNAYARLYAVRAFANEAFLLVCWYADEAARYANENPVKAFEYQVPTPDLKGDLYPAGYAHLKTLPDFAGASDHPVADPGDLTSTSTLATNVPPASA